MRLPMITRTGQRRARGPGGPGRVPRYVMLVSFAVAGILALIATERVTTGSDATETVGPTDRRSAGRAGLAVRSSSRRSRTAESGRGTSRVGSRKMQPEVSRHRVKPLESCLVLPGVLLMASAIVGGAVGGYGLDLPAIQGASRVVGLFALGAMLAILGTASRWGPFARDLLRKPPPPRLAPPGTARPPDPIDHFVGRTAELDQLHQLLCSAPNHRLAISGLGGIGKTQLAVQYLHHHPADYPTGIFWLRGDDATVLTGELANLTTVLQLPEQLERRQALQIQAVMRWLQEQHGWLLVIDGLEESARQALEGHLPRGLKGHLLATSRHQIWGGRLPALEPLSPDLASILLLQRSGQADTSAARQVADRLGCLPLALEQASAYLLQTGETLQGYLRLLEEDPAHILAGGHLESGVEPVATTWELNFRQVENTSPAAADLLRLCGFLAPDDIPFSLLAAGALALPRGSRLRAALARGVRRNEAVSVLLDYSLVKRQGEYLSAPRLVQDVLRLSLTPDQARRWAAIAIQSLNITFPHGWELTNWASCRPLVPHALAAAQFAIDLDVEPRATARLLDAAASYLRATGQLAAARPLHERDLAIRERVLGADHPDTATSLTNLGLLLRAQGDLEAARPLLERALAIRERVLGPNHADTAASLSSLGVLLYDQRDLDAARPVLSHALAIQQRVLRPDHPAVAQTLSSLGMLLRAQEDLAGARPLLERALDIRERALGPQHPSTATSLNNLGLLLHDQGDLGSARRCFTRALEISERVLEPEHPVTAASLNNLATLHLLQGDPAAARPLLERAIAIRQRVLGTDHPDTVDSRESLARASRPGIVMGGAATSLHGRPRPPAARPAKVRR